MWCRTEERLPLPSVRPFDSHSVAKQTDAAERASADFIHVCFVTFSLPTCILFCSAVYKQTRVLRVINDIISACK
jgi:hypothetical protein